MGETGSSSPCWDFPYLSRRLPVLARNAVATTQPLAAQAGLAMLLRGGNAVDAAVATAIALTVVEPTSNGLGSDLFAMVWDGAELHGLNASGRSPSGWTQDAFGGGPPPSSGWNSATVPGAVSAWGMLSRRFGRLPFADLCEPAIRYASDGFLVTPVIAELWRRQVERLQNQPGFRDTFLPHGRAPAAGEHFRPPHQAATLSAIAESGGESLYRGALADRVAAAAAEAGALVTAHDLAAHACDWVTPIDIGFHGVRVHELPPNGQGLGALVALGILDRLDLDGLAPDGAELAHLQIEAMKLGLTDVALHVADPAGMATPVAELLDTARLEALAAGIDRSRASVPPPPPIHRGGTVYLCAGDASGMMVSLIQSNYEGFGSGVVVPGTGIALNNRGSCFSADPAHPNALGPRKRPLNTIIPGFLSRDGAPLAAFGVMGGTMQTQGHVQVVGRMVLGGQNPQAALDAPRWRVDAGTVLVEATLPQETAQGLLARGHRLGVDDPLRFGAGQIVHVAAQGYVAASESRRDGQAVGF